MFEFLTQPKFPRAAIGIEHASLTALELRGEGKNRYSVERASTVELPHDLVKPGFTESNISSTAEFRTLLEEAAIAAGLAGQKKWSVSLPSSTARSAIISFDKEKNSGQTEEVFDWKAEQIFGAPAGQLRINKYQISPDPDGKRRYFATAVKLAVLDEYETVFEQLGWQVGLILPKAVAESKWLSAERPTADSLLISAQHDGFTAVLLRGTEPAVVRSVTCLPAEFDDEVFRLLMFYHDRFSGRGPLLERLLLVGRDLVPEKIRDISAEAFGRAVSVVKADEIGLRLPGGGLSFDDLAAPGALASFGFR